MQSEIRPVSVCQRKYPNMKRTVGDKVGWGGGGVIERKNRRAFDRQKQANRDAQTMEEDESESGGERGTGGWVTDRQKKAGIQLDRERDRQTDRRTDGDRHSEREEQTDGQSEKVEQGDGGEKNADKTT